MKLTVCKIASFLVLLSVPAISARADDTDKLAAMFAPVLGNGGVVTIPAGDYHLDDAKPLPIPSHTTVLASGARFHLPQTLGDKARVVLFQGTNVTHFTWQGGEFLGHVFDPSKRENSWEPNVNTRVFYITTTATGKTSDILFRDVKSDGIAGAVIHVEGRAKPGSESEVESYAERIHVEGCTLLRSGKFMWDYGFLWQTLVWASDYEPWEVERAKKYFRNDLVREALSMMDGDDRVLFDNRNKPLPVAKNSEPSQAMCFFGDSLPRNIVRGHQYFVVESKPDYLRIADQPGGSPICFEGSGGSNVKLVYDLQSSFWALYAPVGGGPGKGGVDITSAKDVRITGCQLSALGDTMHVQRSRNIVFANNHIIGSRMGAFFLAEYCQNATVTGNMVDGSNGSRVISVEKSAEDVVITGNTFRNGGRGSWINQPKNLIIANNLFVDNTTKGSSALRKGRRSYETGEPRRFPEMYFTLHEKDGSYGPVIVRDNIFVLGPDAPDEAVTFAPNGRDIRFSGNTFQSSKP
ncbi:MAG TPA: NosD domain-containing protein, partial [Roseimicrobium sp.]|nr:NosD domain-containing protein [Roseimicrobium sp.]